MSDQPPQHYKEQLKYLLKPANQKNHSSEEQPSTNTNKGSFKYYPSQAAKSLHNNLPHTKIFLDSSQTQHNTLLDILAEHRVLLDRILSQNAVVSNMMSIFSIKSVESLKELDALLATQSDPYIRQIKTLLGGNAERNLHQVFAQNFIMSFNVDGSFGKNRLQDYKKVFSAMIDVISSFSEASDKTLRAAFQRQKKIFKQSTRYKAKENTFNDNEGDSPGQE